MQKSCEGGGSDSDVQDLSSLGLFGLSSASLPFLDGLTFKTKAIPGS
jgi:hypothetical protein